MEELTPKLNYRFTVIEAIDFLTKGVRLHGVFSAYFLQNKDATEEDYIESMKRQCENMHVEQIFNSLCDCYSAEPFQPALPIINKLLNNPKIYEPRTYFIK